MTTNVGSKTKYGLVFYHKTVEGGDSPQAECFKKGHEKGHAFFVCQETANARDRTLPHKNYTSDVSVDSFVRRMQSVISEGWQNIPSHFSFYEIWESQTRGCMVFDVEWNSPTNDIDDTKMRLFAIHEFVVRTIREINPEIRVDFPLITCDSRQKETVFKESFHLYYKSVMVENNHTVLKTLYVMMQGRIPREPSPLLSWRDEDNELKWTIDFNIATKNRLFRMAFCRKQSAAEGTCLIPISNRFLSGSAPLDRTSLCALPWNSNDGAWMRHMTEHTATGPWFDQTELKLSDITRVLVNDPMPEGGGALAMHRRRIAEESGQKELVFHMGADRTPVVARSSNLMLPQGTRASSTSRLREIGRLIARVINNTDGSHGAEFIEAFDSGVIQFASTSKMCVYRGREHKHNHISFSAIVSLPFPKVYYRCLDEDCCVQIETGGKIQVKVDERLWHECNYRQMVERYYDEYEISDSDLIQLF